MINFDNLDFDKKADRWSYPKISRILDDVKNSLVEMKVIESHDFRFLLSVSFSRALSTFEEIITLLYYGYPNGALALSRNLYENFIIILFIKSYCESNPSMVQKFMDTYALDIAKIRKKYHEDILSNISRICPDNKNYDSIKQEAQAEVKKADLCIADFEKKYPQYRQIKNGKDFWWARDILLNKSTFKDIEEYLVEHDKFPISFRSLYMQASAKVHSGFFGLYNNLGDLSSDLILSHAFDGYEIPLGFSIHIFCWYMLLFTMRYQELPIKPYLDELLDIAKEYNQIILGVS